MADIDKIKLPNNTVVNIKDSRIPGVDTEPTSGSDNVVTSGGVYDSIQSAIGSGITIYDVEPDTSTAGTWKGTSSEIESLYDGLTIRYKVPIAGASTTTLNVNNLGAKTVYRAGSTKLTTNYAVGSYILLYYSSLNGGCWEVYSDYDANSYSYVRQYQEGNNAAGTAPKYPLLARYNVTNKNGSYDTAYSRYHTGATLDTSTGELEATSFVKTGGTSSQFLKADGSVDSNTYALASEIPDAQIQSDWNQTTTTAKDYIKNKPNVVNNGNGVVGINHSTFAAGIVNISDGKNSISLNDASDDGILITTNNGSDGRISLTSSSNIELNTTGTNKAYYNNKEIATKNDIPAVDATPTSGSTNAVSSGGVYTALNDKAPKASPALTGTPTAPTATAGTNTTQIATTAFVTNAVSTAVGSVYRVKGTKATYADLPSSGNTTGDVWNVTASYGSYPAGTNWVWTGSAWDALGGEIDLSNYYTKTEVDSKDLWEAGTGTSSVIVKNSVGTAAGNYSTVEGYKSETGGTYTSNDISISGHDGTNGSYSHAEGLATIASGPRGAHAEGAKNLASGAAAHVEGGWNKATGQFSHAEGYLTTASNESAHAEGRDTTASGIISHAEGQSTTASSSRSHAEGYNTVASGNTSHAEGAYTKATNDAAHSEGYGTIASGNYAHSEGRDSIATGNYSHAEGHSVAKGIFSHSENGDKGMEVWPVGSANATTYTSTFDEEWRSVRTAVGDTVFANIIKSSEIELKSDNTALPIKITDASYSGDTLTFSTESTLSTTALSGSTEYWINMSMAYGARSHSENMGNTSYGEGSHAEGEYTVALGNYSHAEGQGTTASGDYSHAEGSATIAAGSNSHAEGQGDKTLLLYKISGDAGADAYTTSSEHDLQIGNIIKWNDKYRKVTDVLSETAFEVDSTFSASSIPTAAGEIARCTGVSYGPYSHSEGYRTQSTEEAGHAEGSGTVASGAAAHAEGHNTTASGLYSHAEGYQTEAIGVRSHAEGRETVASGQASHAEGEDTTASGYYSHAEGGNTLAQNSCEHAEGQYNKSNKANTTFGNAGNTIHSVGIGTGTSARKNAFEVMQNGDAYLYGLGTYNGTNPTTGTNDIKTIINGKQATLVSGTNIKTINNESILGSGNITISSGVEQEQADWKQNDNTQVDFIKNRTHYITETTYDSGLKTHIATYGKNLSTNEYYFSVADTFVVTSSTPADVTSGIRDFVLYNYEYNLVQNTYPENSSSFVLVYEAIGYLKAGAIAPIQRHLYRITFNCGIVSGGLSISNPIAQHISPTEGTATTLTAMGGKIITFHKLDNRYLDIDSVIDSKTSDFVPKSGTTEMSDNAVLSFPSEDWNEENDTGYKTEISNEGVHCYDPDDGFELHMNPLDGSFLAGYPSGGHTQYGCNSITNSINSSTSYSYSFPNKTGTFAMTSDIPTVPTLTTWDKYAFCIQARPGQAAEELTDIEVGPINIRLLDDALYHGRPVFLVIDSSESPDCHAVVLQLSYYDYSDVELVFSDYYNCIALHFDPNDVDQDYVIDGQNIGVYVTYPLALKQNVISDLSTIRSGAALGTTSLQPGDVPTYYTGTTDPSSSLGSNGDIYLKLSS